MLAAVYFLLLLVSAGAGAWFLFTYHPPKKRLVWKLSIPADPVARYLRSTQWIITGLFARSLWLLVANGFTVPQRDFWTTVFALGTLAFFAIKEVWLVRLMVYSRRHNVEGS